MADGKIGSEQCPVPVNAHLLDKLASIENTIAQLTRVLEDTCNAVQRLCAAQAETYTKQSRHDKLLEDLVEMQHQNSQLLAMMTTRDDQQVRMNGLEKELKRALRVHHDNLESRLEDSTASHRSVMLRIGGLSSAQDKLHEGQAACTNQVRLASASQQSRDLEGEPSSKRRPSVPTTASVTSSTSTLNWRQAKPPALTVMTSDDDVVIQNVRHHSSSAMSDRYNASPPFSVGPSHGSASNEHEAQESASRKTSDLFLPAASVLNSNLSTRAIPSLLPAEDQATDEQPPDLVAPLGIVARGDIKDDTRFSLNPDFQPTSCHGSTVPSSLRQTPRETATGSANGRAGIPAKGRCRWVYSRDVIRSLERVYTAGNHYVDVQTRQMLADSLGLTNTQVKVWFQNRRYRKSSTKRSERMSSSSSKR